MPLNGTTRPGPAHGGDVSLLGTVSTMSETRELPQCVQEAIDQTPCRVQEVNPEVTTESFALHTGASIFGRLIKMTTPIIDAYHGDLYHDALYLNKMLLNWDRKTHMQFRYAFDNCGTWFLPKDDPDAGLFTRDYVVDITIYAEKDRYGYDVVYLKIQPAAD